LAATAGRSILRPTLSPICRIALRAAFSRRIATTAFRSCSVESFFSLIFRMLWARSPSSGASSALLFFSSFAGKGGGAAGSSFFFTVFAGGGGASASPPTRSTTATERNLAGGERKPAHKAHRANAATWTATDTAIILRRRCSIGVNARGYVRMRVATPLFNAQGVR
jgi:hypothetical protein